MVTFFLLSLSLQILFRGSNSFISILLGSVLCCFGICLVPFFVSDSTGGLVFKSFQGLEDCLLHGSYVRSRIFCVPDVRFDPSFWFLWLGFIVSRTASFIFIP